jgi:hypothetical protein
MELDLYPRINLTCLSSNLVTLQRPLPRRRTGMNTRERTRHNKIFLTKSEIYFTGRSNPGPQFTARELQPIDLTTFGADSKPKGSPWSGTWRRDHVSRKRIAGRRTLAAGKHKTRPRAGSHQSDRHATDRTEAGRCTRENRK